MKKFCVYASRGRDYSRLRKILLTMKLSVFLFLLGMLSVQANEMFSQTSLNLQLEKASLEEVLEEIQEQTDYGFIYDYEYVKEYDTIDVDFNNASMDAVLYELLKETNLDYRLEEKMIVLFPREIVRPKTTETKTVAEQEKNEVKGTVTDDQGVPLPGVSVIIKGTNFGVATNIDGEYALEFEQNDVVLVYSFVGMTSKEVVYTGQKVINVTLGMDTEQMAEVVVNGYQTISKERATGSYVTVGTDKLNRVETTNIAERLEGLTPGVLVQKRDADGGEELYLQIRGKSTLHAEATPLIVIDGFPTEGKLGDINPNDIKSINILQDASAASIWGARAANGVVVITTKKGARSDKPQIEFASSMIITPRPNMDNLGFADTDETISIVEELFDKGLGFVITDLKAPIPPGGSGPDIHADPLVQILADEYHKRITPEEKKSRIDELRKNNALKEYERLFLRTGIKQQHNLSIRGGNDKFKYFTSLRYVENKSKFKGDQYQQINVTSNNTYKISNRLEGFTNVALSYKKDQFNGIGFGPFGGGSSIHMPVYGRILDQDGKPTLYGHEEVMGPRENQELIDKYDLYDVRSSLYRDFKERDVDVIRKNIKLALGLSYKITDGLKFHTNAMYETYSRKKENLHGANSQYIKRYITMAARLVDNPVTGGKKVEKVLPEGGLIQKDQSEIQSWTVKNKLNLERSFGKHDINAVLGTELRQVYSKGHVTEHFGYNPKTLEMEQVDNKLLSKGYRTINGRFSRTPVSKFVDSKNRYFSYYTNIGYSFDKRYDFSISGRIDDSNLFGAKAKNRKTPLWSVGSGWTISNEDFFNVTWINNLRLRATYGTSGNVARDSYPFAMAEVWIYGNHTTGERSARITNPANPELKWETSHNTNLALDFNLFNGRFSGSLTRYYKYTKDVLTDFANNPISGYSLIRINNGEIKNRGWEVNLNGNIGKKLKWQPQFHLSYNKNIVSNAKNISGDADHVLRSISPGMPKVGYSISSEFAFKSAGLDDKGRPMVYDENGKKRGFDDEMVTDSKALIHVGQLEPRFYGAFTNTFKYKGFSLYAMITYKMGHIFKKPINYNFDPSEGHFLKRLADRWTPQNKDTDVAAIPTKMERFSSQLSYRHNGSDTFDKADHIRLKEVSLRYQLDRKLLTNTPFQFVEFSAQVSNIGLLWKATDLDLDPDYIPGNHGASTGMSGELDGINRFSGKPAPIYTLGLKVSF